MITDVLDSCGGYVDELELSYQLAKKGLNLSLDEIGNQCRMEELAGRIEVRTSYRRVSEDA